MSKDVTMEGKSLQEYSQEKLGQAAKMADAATGDYSLKKPLKEDHFHKLYFFKTEHDKLVASVQMLRQQLQEYGKSIIPEYFPEEKDAVINLEERSISRQSKIVTPENKIEVPK